MEQILNMYTGTLQYRGLELLFAFSGNELRLIPANNEQKKTIDYEWRMKPIREGVYTFADPTPVGVMFLVGKCNETGRKMIFYPMPNCYLSYDMSTIYIPLYAYTTCLYDRDSIDRVQISCTEIDYIHPVQTVLDKQFDQSQFIKDGSATINIHSFSETTTDKQTFEIDDKKASVYFGIWRRIGGGNDEPPLSAYSSIIFEFEPTDNYGFIINLWWIAKKFISYLCYRTNINISTMQLEAPTKDGKHERFATIHFLNQNEESEPETLKAGRYISQQLIAGSEGCILTDIAKDMLYTRHLPNSYKSGRSINAARFVMLVAAFEWEFSKQYPYGIKKSQAQIDAEKKVCDEIQEKIEESSGKKRKIYKHLLNLVESGSLQSEIVQVGNDYSSIIDTFGTHLYAINGEKLVYSDMGKRLGDQRNAYAHGDLDKDFIGLSLLDLIYLEMILYAMQLKHYGLDDTRIKHAINNLFNQHMMIRKE